MKATSQYGQYGLVPFNVLLSSCGACVNGLVAQNFTNFIVFVCGVEHL